MSKPQKGSDCRLKIGYQLLEDYKAFVFREISASGKEFSVCYLLKSDKPKDHLVHCPKQKLSASDNTKSIYMLANTGCVQLLTCKLISVMV